VCADSTGNIAHTFHALLSTARSVVPLLRLGLLARGYLVRGRIWPVYSLALAHQVTRAVWRLAGRLPSRLLQSTRLFCVA
jgi:hypothetical protein